MQSINFDNGYKTYAINGDENNVIKVNVTDPNILTRFEAATKVIEKTLEKMKGIEEPTAADLSAADKTVKEQLNYIFGSDVCTPAFGVANVLSPVESGGTLFEAFMTAFMPIIEKDINASLTAAKINLESKTDKYTKPITTQPTANPTAVQSVPKYVGMVSQNTPKIDVSGLTEGEKKALLMELLK